MYRYSYFLVLPIAQNLNENRTTTTVYPLCATKAVLTSMTHPTSSLAKAS